MFLHFLFFGEYVLMKAAKKCPVVTTTRKKSCAEKHGYSMKPFSKVHI